MTPNYNICDICGDKVGRECRVEVITAHGHTQGEYAPTTRIVDLCPQHQADAIKFLLGTDNPRVDDVDRGRKFSVFIDRMKEATKKL